MKKPLVTVIVVNWNGEAVLEDCLESLSRQTYSNWELIFVDNGSNDSSLGIFEKFTLNNKRRTVLIKNMENLGFVGGNNLALNQAEGKYLLLLNNDTKFGKDLLTKLVDKMEHDESVGALQPKILMMEKPQYLDNAGSFITWIGFWKHWGFGERDSEEFSFEREIFAAKGACLMTRRSLVNKIGLFDPDYFSYFEETDFCWRVWLSGFRVVYFPQTNILHKVGHTIKRLDVAYLNFHYYKNRLNSLLKNLGTVRLLTVVPVHIGTSFFIAVAFLLVGNASGFGVITKALWWNLLHIGGTINKRRKVQRQRKVSDREIFLKLSVSIDWLNFYRSFRRVSKDIES